MFVSCDIGNSTSVFGVFKENELIKTWAVSTSKILSKGEASFFLHKTFSTYGLDIKTVTNACISSVVPSVNKFYKSFFSSLPCDFMFISSKIKTGIDLCVDNPETLGADRIVNAAYAYYLSKEFQIIIDTGTALTIDVVNGNGKFMGGVIFPGMTLLAGCLKEKTDMLPLIDIKKPNLLIGRNAVSSIESGIFYGTVFLIKGFVEAIYREFDIKKSPVIFTGGLSRLIAGSCQVDGMKYVDEFWTIKGIKYIYDLNNPK